MVRSTARVVIAPPSTSHHAGDANPEKITEGFAIANTAANRKNRSVVIASAKNPEAQAAMVKTTRIPPRTDTAEASTNRGDSHSNRATPPISARGAHRVMAGARGGTALSRPRMYAAVYLYHTSD